MKQSDVDWFRSEIETHLWLIQEHLDDAHSLLDALVDQTEQQNLTNKKEGQNDDAQRLPG